MTELGPLVAFIGGFLSFLSPCVLPLVPGYISMTSGVGIDKLKKGEGTTAAVATSSLLFILGFSTVFVGLGASASTVGQFLSENRLWFNRIAGVIIILFGLFLLGAFKISALYREQRLHVAGGTGKAGSFLLGFAFAFGWTPCIGPILGAVLLLAAREGTLAQGVFLLAVYSLGLGVPFFLSALAINKFLTFYQGFRRYLQWVERAAGVLLIAVGLLVFTNQLTWLSRYFAWLNRFSPELLLSESVTSPAAAAGAPAVGELKPAPDTAFQRPDGSSFRVSELRGKVVVVNFWATWCLPCRLEIPSFNKVAHEYEARGVAFVGVSVDEGGWNDINTFMKEVPIEYPVVLDSNQKADQDFGPLPGLPVTIFIDREGRIVHRSLGITDIDELRQTIEGML
ncbi:MAG TPA: cytochrome c biogenesis protein CcdA [Candidatus Acidoferrales bacterium]|nr:cytochrome c biogenesis protein CcdA [Candidatus Acidoferrales bacterium]